MPNARYQFSKLQAQEAIQNGGQVRSVIICTVPARIHHTILQFPVFHTNYISWDQTGFTARNFDSMSLHWCTKHPRARSWLAWWIRQASLYPPTGCCGRNCASRLTSAIINAENTASGTGRCAPMVEADVMCSVFIAKVWQRAAGFTLQFR